MKPNQLGSSIESPGATVITARSISTVAFLSWLSMLGFDFLLHAGLLARLYLKPSPFLLPPETAFRMIPLGYLSFLTMALLITWLMVKQRVKGRRDGLIYGLKLGGLIWGSYVIGLASITTAEHALLLGWFLGQTAELGIAGAVIGSSLGGVSYRRVFTRVIVFVVFSVFLTIVLQLSGFAPPALVINRGCFARVPARAVQFWALKWDKSPGFFT